jgi:hypothetical protein
MLFSLIDKMKFDAGNYAHGMSALTVNYPRTAL